MIDIQYIQGLIGTWMNQLYLKFVFNLCEETISRTDEGQPRPKYIFNKCGTNIYFLLYSGLVHHHHWILNDLNTNNIRLGRIYFHLTLLIRCFLLTVKSWRTLGKRWPTIYFLCQQDKYRFIPFSSIDLTLAAL